MTDNNFDLRDFGAHHIERRSYFYPIALVAAFFLMAAGIGGYYFYTTSDMVAHYN